MRFAWEGASVEHLARKLPVGGLDVLVGRRARHAQCPVVVGRRPDHQAPSAAPPRSPLALPRRGTREREDAAPPSASEVDPTRSERCGGCGRRGAGGCGGIGGHERERGQRERH